MPGTNSKGIANAFLRLKRKLLEAPISLKAERDKLVHSRKPLSGDEFLADLGVEPPSLNAAIGLRNVIGELCGVPGEILRPEDPTVELSQLMWPSGWDWPEAVKKMERTLGIRINESLRSPFPPIFGEALTRDLSCATLKEWILKTIAWLDVIGETKGPWHP
jgi:hypothetical protein